MAPSEMESPEIKLIAFYLPQFHPIPENDEFWGKGFTEWTNVTRAKPLYPGHVQPRLPGELGFYDLRLPEVANKQAELAKEYGLHGFCYYYYWFSPEKTLLDRPLKQLLESPEPDFPFCLCWANENWTRRWDGSEDEILVKQSYSDEFAEAFIESLLPYFRDDRYIRIDGKPVLLVYDTRQFLDIRKSTSIWRKLVRAAGFDDIYLIRCNTFLSQNYEIDPKVQGFDACVEFPPHGTNTQQLPIVESKVEHQSVHDSATVFDQETVVFNSITRAPQSYELLRALFPSWDNTPRKKQAATIYFGSSPELYQEWLSGLIAWTKRHNARDRQIIFVNAWNEWAEGAVLEPDKEHGRRYLEATKSALQSQSLLYEPGSAAHLAALVNDCTLSANAKPVLQGKQLNQSEQIICELEQVGIGESGFYAEGYAFIKNKKALLAIVAFDDDQLVGSTINSVYRADLAERFGASAMRAGFALHLPKLVKPKGMVRVFAFSEDSIFQDVERQTSLCLEA